ncbi:uncharacterized protein LOC112574701 [Pomacea canaliculata]|uniref:uncharacterized protein LOC112574701 n=1 Tax=Pomacea canaliculata TaxID=400727 RepID=UPI000D734130|nr:uncharacterized protein LOC112574701 [Pomacea canaliculata]
MSGHLPSASQQKRYLNGCPVPCGRSARSQKCHHAGEIYYHCVTVAQAALLASPGMQPTFQEIKQKTGAHVQLDHDQSAVQNTRAVLIRGSRPQIDAAVEFINQKTGAQGPLPDQARHSGSSGWRPRSLISTHAPTSCLLSTSTACHVRQSAGGQDVLVLQSAPGQAGQSRTLPAVAQVSIPPVYDSDVRDDAAMQRILFCLQKMSEQKGEVLVGLSQLQFGQYLGEPCYAAAAAQFPIPANLPEALPRNWKRGEFDVLLIHRHYGFVVCEVKAFGDNLNQLNMSQESSDSNIRKKLKDAVTQLDKAEAMLSHLVSDIAPGLRITKTIAVPNLTTSQVQQAVSHDPQLSEDLCRCLGTTDPAITDLCLCYHQSIQK